jgi:hypothetical protein
MMSWPCSTSAHPPALRAGVAVVVLATLAGGAARAQDAATPPAASASAPAPAPAPARAPESTAPAAEPGTRLQVADPYIELHTGPGRGFPVDFVAERGALITIELRRTDWYRVSTPGPQGGRVGWVHRSQLASTLTEAGGTVSFRDLVVDDYLTRRLELGAGGGTFESEPMLKLWGTYRLAETLSVEGTLAQVQGTFSGTDFWHLGLVSEPWSDLRLSPFFSVGLGRFRNIPNTSLVGAQTTDSNLGYVGLGVRWYIAERFVARLDWSLYTAFVSDARSPEYRALTLGISFFF